MVDGVCRHVPCGSETTARSSRPAVTLRQQVSFAISRASLVSFVLRLGYSYAAISLILGVGGGFYVLALVLVVTLGRTMASCWALLTALESAQTR